MADATMVATVEIGTTVGVGTTIRTSTIGKSIMMEEEGATNMMATIIDLILL